MTDTTDASPPTVTETTTEAPAVEAPSENGLEPAAGEEIALPDGKTLFDREYVERVRAETREHREKRRELEAKLAEYAPLESYDAEDRAVWLNLATAYSNDPMQAADAFEAIAKAIKGGEVTVEQGQEVLEQASEEAAEEGKALTSDDVKRIMEERDAERDVQTRNDEVIKGIQKTLDDAGYPDGSIEAMTILTYATQKKVTLDAAIQAYKDTEQKIIDAYVAGKKPGPRTMAGAPGEENPEPIKGIDDASKRAQAWLRNQPTEMT